MERNEVLEKVIEICRDVFEDEDIVLTEKTTAEEVETWDSLTNLTLINELEEEFHVAFSLDDMAHGHSVGDLVDILMAHLNKK